MIRYLYFLCAYFLLYSFIGWCLEVVYHAVCAGTIVNRGFLNGPVCPIYGVGMLCVLTILSPVLSNLPLLFIGGTLFASIVELIGGFVLYKLFHMRWWDYSKEPFNLGGFVCAKFSLAWGVCILVAVRIVHPLVELNVTLFDCLPGYLLMGALYAVLIADLICTVVSVSHLNRELKRLSALSKEIRGFSDTLTEKIGETALETNTKLQESRVQAALARSEARDQLEEDLQEKREQLAAGRRALQEKKEQLSAELAAKRESLAQEYRARLAAAAKSRHFGTGRLLRAFPELRHADLELAAPLVALKERLSGAREKLTRKQQEEAEHE